MNWIVTLVIGGIIGWLASIFMKTNAQMGLVANIIVGVIGSIIGFWLAGVLGVAAGNTLVAYLIAVVGAIALVYPGLTVFALAVMLGINALIWGVFAIFEAFALRRMSRGESGGGGLRPAV